MTPKLAYELGKKAAEEENLKVPFISDEVRERNRNYVINFLKGSVPGVVGGAALGAYLGNQLPSLIRPDTSTSMMLGGIKGGLVTGYLYSDIKRKMDEAEKLRELNRKVDLMYKGNQNEPHSQTSI